MMIIFMIITIVLMIISILSMLSIMLVIVLILLDPSPDSDHRISHQGRYDLTDPSIKK